MSTFYQHYKIVNHSLFKYSFSTIHFTLVFLIVCGMQVCMCVLVCL